MRLRLPGARAVWVDARAAAWRFPESLLASFVTGALVMLVIDDVLPDDPMVQRIIGTIGLGIPLAFAVACAGERRRFGRGTRVVAMLGLALVLVGWTLMARTEPGARFSLRYVQLSLAAHLLVAFLPYVGGRGDGFWEYNAALFIRFATAGFYSGVLYFGLVIALATAHSLLGLPTSARTYGRLYVSVAFGFNTWFFLAGVPDPLPDGPSPGGYPAGLRVFTQYILIPLVTLYVVIMYAHMGKIVLEQTWPRGTVGYLVSGFSILGIFTLLLVHPIQDTTENRWLRTYARTFYLALFPLVVLLTLATWRRVAEYGVTERRYLLLALGAWIAGIAGYYALRRGRDLRVVPVTLCVVALATAFGPWSAYAVSWRSQMARLVDLLARNGLLADGRLTRASGMVPLREQKALSLQLDYLTDLHGAAGLERWFDASVVEQARTAAVRRGPFGFSTHAESEKMMVALGATYVAPWEREAGTANVHLQRRAPEGEVVLLSLGGYDALFAMTLFVTDARSEAQVAASSRGRAVRATLRWGGPGLEVTDGRSTVVLPLDELFAELGKRRRAGIPNFTAEEMALEGRAPTFLVKVYFETLDGTFAGDTPRVSNASGTVLFRLLE